MPVNNLQEILKIIDPKSDDEFYVIHLIKRRNDNPEMSHGQRVIGRYTFSSAESLLRQFDDIKVICDATNARAYINLTCQSKKRTSLNLLAKLADRIKQDNYESKNLFFSLTPDTRSKLSDKIWILDIDADQLVWLEENQERLLKNIDTLGGRFVAKLPSKSGYHIVCTPFNTHSMAGLLDVKLDIMKLNPTNLYIP